MKKDERLKEDLISWESSEIRFAIDDYGDIFSDFDPRPVPIKGFSEEFLSEARRASLVKDEEINFIFMIPKEKRNPKEEVKIEDRLKKYFKKHLKILEKGKKGILKKGFSFIFLGILLMFIATYLFFTFRNESFLTSFFTILLEPGGWFLFWEGLDLVIFDSKKANLDLDFHRKMVNAKIKFESV